MMFLDSEFTCLVLLNSFDKMTRFFFQAFDYLTLLLLNPLEIKKFRIAGYENHFKFHILMLSYVNCCFSILFAVYTFGERKTIQLDVGTTLQFVQTMFPILISLYLAVDFVKDEKIVLSLKISKSLLRKKNYGVKLCKLKMIFRLLVLFSTRGIKFYNSYALVNVFYSLCNTMPELILAMSDFAFTFFIELLTCEIIHFNNKLKAGKIDSSTIYEVEARLLELQKSSQNICKVYSSRLIVTITFNFITLVISLYWTFIRIVFHHIDYASLSYYVQPVLCVCTIFNSTHQLAKAVNFLSLMVK